MKFEWTADTAETALHMLAAAEAQIESQLLALNPGSSLDRRRTAQSAPVRLTVQLDIGDLVQLSTERHAFQAQMRETQP